MSRLDNWPRVIQLAWARYHTNGSHLVTESFIIQPDGFTIPKDAEQVHGISTVRAMKEGQPIKTVLEKFQKAAFESDGVVAHNLRFDENVIGSEFLRAGLAVPFQGKSRICTMIESTDFCKIPSPRGGYKWPSLGELYYTLFGKKPTECHEARADVETCVKCFFDLTRRGIIGASKDKPLPSPKHPPLPATSPETSIEINGLFQRALDWMEQTDKPLFITGKAGTGKSTLLQYFRRQTKKRIVILAPTGVAALNVNGETLHSFFRFPPAITPQEAQKLGRRRARRELYATLDAIVIDEISMVRADLLDCIDLFLRAACKINAPFGDKQLICIGDLYQLPPVVRADERVPLLERYPTPYFFSSDVIHELTNKEEGIGFVELEKIYRQHDDTFIALLNAVRNRSATQADLVALNKRCIPSFDDPRFICLTATNQQADALNTLHLSRLTSKAVTYQGTVSGSFSEQSLPTVPTLFLKSNARVMFLNNDPLGRWVNGTLGRVKTVEEGKTTVTPDEGETVTVDPFTWTLYRSTYNVVAKTIESERLGSFTQIPLRLAWATTIHKCQGKTFDRVTIDLGQGAFAAGQVYVALSRCRTFEGIVLKQPLKPSHLLLDDQVVKFLTSLKDRY